MSEETAQATATEAAEQQESATQTKPTETVEFWKQKAREQETRAKANATAAQRLQEIEDASKTEQQRATEALSAAEKRAGEAEATALRFEIAFEKGLTPAQAKRLVGSTREELEADADDLKATFAPASNADDVTSQVTTSLDLGTRGTTTATADGGKADLAKWLQS